MLEYIKLSEYAKIKGIHYRTAVKHYKKGQIEGYTDQNERYYVKNPNWEQNKNDNNKNKVILYARVSSTVNN